MYMYIQVRIYRYMYCILSLVNEEREGKRVISIPPSASNEPASTTKA